MARLSREESQQVTRQQLLRAAAMLFARDGYVVTSVDRIAEEAGFSKGGFYSNFKSKEEIFLQVLDDYGRESLAGLMSRLESAATPKRTIDLVAAWAHERSTKGNWPSLILEFSRHADLSSGLHRSLEDVLRWHWNTLGERLLEILPLKADAQTLGAMIHELAYAPAMSFVRGISAADLVRLALTCACSGR